MTLFVNKLKALLDRLRVRLTTFRVKHMPVDTMLSGFCSRR
jgi:hypothetical protein